MSRLWQPNFIILEYGCESIGGSAFSYCSSLVSITIPDSVTSIGNYAFNDCSGLTLIAIGEGVTSIGERAFGDCNSLATVTFRDNSQLTSIGSHAFYTCSSLTSVDFGANSQLVSIGSYAFQYCRRLTSITIPDSVTSICNSAFGHCSSLTSITIPDSVTSIGGSAFFYCSSLTSITMPDGVTSIDVGVFSNCSSLTSITIPSSVTSIGDSAFSNCTALTEINYNAKNVSDLSSNNHVFSYAGQDGTGITVNIGSNVTKIPSYIFCPDSNSFEQGFLPNITTVNFEEGSVCERIGEHAFQYCRRLTSITIPERVTEISSDAFYGCSSLNEVTAESDDIYLALTSQSACGYLIYYVYATGETVRVLKSVVDSVDPDFTINTYLNGSNFTRSEEGDYYVYTHI